MWFFLGTGSDIKPSLIAVGAAVDVEVANEAPRWFTQGLSLVYWDAECVCAEK